ncbi:MAG: nuclear transport factor 2 family protein [Novosphingobium sp.]|nr:nuclear transport factor 2 family protein [Novosphingobium sp.]
MTGIPNFEDWLAICNLKAAYCRFLDTKDWDSWMQLFTEDVVVDTSGSGGNVSHGRDVFVASVRGSIESAKTAHQVHSPEITIHGDEARAVWAMQDRVAWGDKALTGYGHYHERYVRTETGWRIAEQSLTRLIMDFDKTGE